MQCGLKESRTLYVFFYNLEVRTAQGDCNHKVSETTCY